MKKYKLKNENLESVYIGKYPNGKKVVVWENLKGNKDCYTAIALGKFARFLWILDFPCLRNIEEVVEYAYNNLEECTPDQLLRVVQESMLGWPIELGLVEEIVEEVVDRVYMDIYEALRKVYEEGKKVAYDDCEWLRDFCLIYDRNGPIVYKGYLVQALDKKFNQKRWYVVEDK